MGDSQATPFEHWPAMVRVCRGVLASRADAEDCAAAALVEVLGSPLDDVRNLEALLVIAAQRRALDLQRSRVRARRRDVRLGHAGERGVVDVAEEIVSRAHAVWVDEQARQRLAPKAYELLALLADGLSIGEVAERLEMSQRAAESHLLRARRTMRAVIARAAAAIGLVGIGVRRLLPAAAPATVLAGSLMLLPTLTVPPAPLPAVELQPATDVRSGGAAVSPQIVVPRSPAAVRQRSPVAAPPPAGNPIVIRRDPAGTSPPRPVAGVNGPQGTGVTIEDRGKADPGATTTDQVLACVANARVTAEHVGC